MSHVSMRDQHPSNYQALLELAKSVKESAAAAGIEPRVVHLVNLRTSQLNGCAFCLRMHTQEALGDGESAERLAVLSAWRETRYFDATEQAALTLAEGITRIGTDPVDDDGYARIAAVLDDRQISAIAWLVTAMNGLNRIAMFSKTPVGP